MLIDTSSKYAINAPDVVAEDFDGQIVILNLANGHYFSLRGIAAPMWSLLLAGHPPATILDNIEQVRPDLAQEAVQFLDRLLELTLVCAQSDAVDSSPGAIDEAWVGGVPEIEVFDDLAELIFADPIHDVDVQAGWPTPRAAD